MLLNKNQYNGSIFGILGLICLVVVCILIIFIGITLIFDIIPDILDKNIVPLGIIIFILLLLSLILLLVESRKISKLTKEYQVNLEKSFDSVRTLTQRLEELIIYEVSNNSIFFSKEDVFGYEASAFNSYPGVLENIIYCEDINDYRTKLDDWMKSSKDEIFNCEYRIKSKDGDLIWVEEHIKFWVDGAGNERYTGLILNINTRKQIEIKLLEAKENAEEISRLKSKLMQNLNFELRTPLANILGLTEILKDEVKDENQLDKINQINREGNRLIHTINSIINLSLLDTNKYKVKIDYIPINSIILDIIKEYKTPAEQRGLYLKFISDKEVYALVDIKLFRNIINNLIDNSIKFTLDGGITVYAENKAEGDKQICEIKIEDTGIGISKENIDKIFNEFTKVHNETNGEYYGSGLGLAVAKRMLEILNGEIYVDSTLSIGSVFTIKLPAYKVDKDKKDEFIESPDVELRKIKGEKLTPKVLLVEDNITNKVITFLFLKGFCEIEHATNGSTAIELAKENKYDLVLMDINLGAGINGIETTYKIKQLNNYKNVPFIAVTGYAMPGDEEKLLNLGFDYYLAKPFKREQLLNIIKSALNIT